MLDEATFPRPALKYDVEVQAGGRLELRVPFSPGSRVAVIVIDESDGSNELLVAAQSSLEFWNNPVDDEDWNDA
jgi:hypothetical protein